MSNYSYGVPMEDHHALHGSDSCVDDCCYQQEPKEAMKHNQVVPTTPPLLYEPPIVQRKRFSFSTLGTFKQDIAASQHESDLSPSSASEKLTKTNPLRNRPRAATFQSSTKWDSGPFAFDPQELDLPLDDDLWHPSDQVSEMSLNLMDFKARNDNSKRKTLDTGMLFPWMADTEIV